MLLTVADILDEYPGIDEPDATIEAAIASAESTVARHCWDLEDLDSGVRTKITTARGSRYIGLDGENISAVTLTVDGVVIPSTDYVIRNDSLVLKYQIFSLPMGAVIDYTCGYTSANVPGSLKRGILAVFRNIWLRRPVPGVPTPTDRPAVVGRLIGELEGQLLIHHVNTWKYLV